jgi:hypothetical protein
MSKIHHITFATGVSRITGLEYSDTQKMLVNSIQSQTEREVISYTHNLETMKAQSWFHKIEHLSQIEMGESNWWSRDGYFCAYKALFANDLLDKIDEGDYIYYTDSSAYFREPFMQNLDRFFDYVDYNGHICGSHGNDFAHSSFGCLTNQDVWKKIWPESEIYLPNLLEHKHILASWYCFKNTEQNRKFIKEWSYLITDVNIDGRPVVTMHHTVDQSLFNILVYKYGFRTFFNNTNHDHNKNHNNVHGFINSLQINDISELDTWFPKPIEYCR